MDLSRIARIPNRIRQDLKIIRLARNWQEILSAKLSNRPFLTIRFRDGVVLNSPAEVTLNFLFQEIWIDEIYAPAGYEIKANDVVIDIGANIGVFALYAATRAKNVVVHAFEPFPRNAEHFERNLAYSKLQNVRFHNLAVADKTEQRVLHIDAEWIKHSLTDKTSQNSTDKGIIVNCISLDEAMASIEQCDVLKLDCEGSEYEILYSSSPQTLSKLHKIVGEFHEIDNKEKNGKSLRTFLESNNFRIDVFGKLEGNSGIICAKRKSL